MDYEKVDVSSVQPSSSGELPDLIDWSFEAGLLRFQGKYEQAEEMQRQVAGPSKTVVGKGASLHTDEHKQSSDNSVSQAIVTILDHANVDLVVVATLNLSIGVSLPRQGELHPE